MFSKKDEGRKVKIISGKHQGNFCYIKLVEFERDFNDPEKKKQVLIVSLDGSQKMTKVYPHEVEVTH